MLTALLLLGAHHASATAIVDVRAFASINFLGNVTDPDFNPVDPGVIILKEPRPPALS